jgi:hypothetical protein
MTGNTSHASGSSVSSAAGYLPAEYRPAITQSTIRYDGSGILGFSALPDGSILVQYRDYNGAFANRTATNGMSLTYTV